MQFIVAVTAIAHALLLTLIVAPAPSVATPTAAQKCEAAKASTTFVIGNQTDNAWYWYFYGYLSYAVKTTALPVRAARGGS